MDIESNGDGFTVKEVIQLELHSVQVFIDTVWADGEREEPVFVKFRDDLAALLERLNRGQIAPEYAEVEWIRIRERREQWGRDNQIPPD